jgi:redox-sensitive bicupin YhaK (pirin superfamily)
MLGLKSWIALPGPQEETTPSFQHFDADSLPIVEDGGLRIAGTDHRRLGLRERAFGMLSDWSYVAVVLDAGAVAPLDADHEERAIYIVDGEIDIADDRSEGPRLLIFHPGDRITVKAVCRSGPMFLGGTGMEGPRQYLVELRLLEPGTDRASQGRRLFCAARGYERDEFREMMTEMAWNLVTT